MMKFFVFLVFTFYSLSAFGQAITGKDLLEKSINYHDPKGKWDKFKGTLHITETRPNGADRKTTIKLNNRKNYFNLSQNRGAYQVEKIVAQDQCTHKVNGSVMISDSLVQKLRLTCSQTQRIRNYYKYLWGMPMKLRDAGTNIQERLSQTTFQGKEVLAMKVTYDEAVGNDIWYFYFNPTNYALVGYRFYHDESKNDGEYIPLEGEELIQGIRFPKTRTWYVNKDNLLLGADILEAIGSK